MRDLQKMREEFEKKYKLQEMANNLEEKYGTGIEFYIFERLGKKGGLRISAHSGDLRAEPTSMNLAKRLLNDFPADEKQMLNDTASGQKEPVFGLYRVCAERGFRDNFTTLKLSWLHDGNEYDIPLRIDGNDALEQFFINSTRKMDSSERETYKPTYRGHILREQDLPIMRFKCSHISYSGGHLAATDLAVIDEIISAIKNA